MQQANSRHDISGDAEDENPVTVRHYTWSPGSTWTSGVIHDMAFLTTQYDNYTLRTNTSIVTIETAGVYRVTLYGRWNSEVVAGDNSLKENWILINGAFAGIGGDRYMRETSASTVNHPSLPIGFTRRFDVGVTISAQTRQSSGNDKAYMEDFDEPNLTVTFLGL